MDAEGMREGSWEERKAKGLMSDESFHLDPNKTTDPAEKLLEELGPTKAFDKLTEQLPPTTDKEVVRQMKLILNKVIQKKQH